MKKPMQTSSRPSGSKELRTPRKLKGITIALVATALGAVPAYASPLYCHTNSFRMCLGCSGEANMKVVVNTVPRQVPLGHTPGQWCGFSMHSLSAFYKPMDVVEQPHLGQVKVGSYGVRYTSAKPGEDQFAVMLHQAAAYSGGGVDSKIVVNVEVVDSPF